MKWQCSHTLRVPVAALGDASGGDVPLSALNQQVTIMNQLMSNTPFTFINAGVTRISNVSVRLNPSLRICYATLDEAGPSPAQLRSISTCVPFIGKIKSRASRSVLKLP